MFNVENEVHGGYDIEDIENRFRDLSCRAYLDAIMKRAPVGFF